MNPIHRWARNIHVYTSMIALVLVLFFAVSGITLNHPNWTFGDSTERTEVSGVLPFEATTDDGAIAWLPIAEYARNELGFSGEVDSFGEAAGEASIVFKKPGYSAEITLDVEDSAYQVVVEQQGWVGVMNDLHKGRDANSGWSWVIDVSAIFLVIVAVTGLAMQLYLGKRRTSALWSVAAGTVLAIGFLWWTLA